VGIYYYSSGSKPKNGNNIVICLTLMSLTMNLDIELSRKSHTFGRYSWMFSVSCWNCIS